MEEEPQGSREAHPRARQREVEHRDSEQDRVVGLIRITEIREVTPLRSVGTHKVVLKAYFR